MQLTFLGTDLVFPSAGNDTASYLIDNHTLIDTGWCVRQRLTELQVDQTQIKRLLFTHLHHDHTIGLPGLLFALGHGQPQRTEPLTIYGPAHAGLAVFIDRAMAFLDIQNRPHVVPDVKIIELLAGDCFPLEDYVVHVQNTCHGVPTLAYRFDQEGQALATLCGDTATHVPLIAFARHSQLLIHEASCEYGHNDALTHSSATIAAQLACQAQVGRLGLVHFPYQQAPQRLAEAQALFPATFAPKPLESLVLQPLVQPQLIHTS